MSINNNRRDAGAHKKYSTEIPNIAVELQTKCSVEGCDRPRQSKGYCDKHYRRWRKHGDPTEGSKRGRPRSVHTICSVEGCGKPDQAKGYCREHYYEWRRNDPSTPRCAVEGCQEPITGKGYCAKHYRRWQKYGDPEHVSLRGEGTIQVGDYTWSTASRWRGVTCRVEDCEKPVESHGLCSSHVFGAKFSEEREWMIPKEHRRPRCRMEGCDNPSYNNATELCRKHQGQYERGTLYKEERQRAEEMEEPGDETTIGGRIKNARIRQHLTREELAERLGFDTNQGKNAVRDTEHDASSKHPKAVAQYADALGVSVAELYPEGSELPAEDDPSHGAQMKRQRMLLGMTLGDMATLVGRTTERIRQIELTDKLRNDTVERIVGAFEAAGLDTTDLEKALKQGQHRGRPRSPVQVNRLRVTVARLCSGLTREEIARSVGTTEKALKRFLHAPTKRPTNTMVGTSCEKAQALAEALGVPAWWLQEEGPPRLLIREPTSAIEAATQDANYETES